MPICNRIVVFKRSAACLDATFTVGAGRSRAVLPSSVNQNTARIKRDVTKPKFGEQGYRSTLVRSCAHPTLPLGLEQLSGATAGSVLHRALPEFYDCTPLRNIGEPIWASFDRWWKWERALVSLGYGAR